MPTEPLDTEVADTSIAYSDDDETIASHLGGKNDAPGNALPEDHDEVDDENDTDTSSASPLWRGKYRTRFDSGVSADFTVNSSRHPTRAEINKNLVSTATNQTSTAPVVSVSRNLIISETNGSEKNISFYRKRTVIIVVSVLLPIVACCWCLQGKLNSHQNELQYLHSTLSRQSSAIMALKQEIENNQNFWNEFKISMTNLETDINLKSMEITGLKNELYAMKAKLEAIGQKQSNQNDAPVRGGAHEVGINSGEGYARKIWNAIPNLHSDAGFDKSVNFFRETVRTLMKTFTSQPRDSWVQIISAVLSTMTEETPTRPASILILSSSSMNPDFPLCFARKLAASINNAFQAQRKHQQHTSSAKEIGAQYFETMHSLTAVHEDLKSYLDHEGKAIIIKNLDEIQKETDLLVLHAFCENSNYMAYDTRANFILTLTVPYNIRSNYEWTHWNGPQISREILNTVWKTAVSDDKRGALISRVAGSVVLLQDGDICH